MGTWYVDFCVDSPATAPEILLATSWALRWISLEEERVMQQGSVSISLSFWEPRYQSSTLLHHPFLFKGKPTQCSRGSKKDFWRRCQGVYAKVNIPSTHHNPYLSHYIIFHLPLIFLSPTSPLPFYLPSLSLSLSILPLFLYLPPFVRLLLVCSYG